MSTLVHSIKGLTYRPLRSSASGTQRIASVYENHVVRVLFWYKTVNDSNRFSVEPKLFLNLRQLSSDSSTDTRQVTEYVIIPYKKVT